VATDEVGRMTARFKRSGDGLRMTLSEPERELLRNLPDELRVLYEDDSGTDEARSRLFPSAYLDPTEEHAEEEWQELVHPELLRDRLDNLAKVVDVLSGATEGRRGAIVVELGPDDVPALLGVLNDARLALGTRLGVTDETDVTDLDPSDPTAPVLAVYSWLTYLEGELVETLLGDMPG
jgi:Domain of unknown function (DUF2017)